MVEIPKEVADALECLRAEDVSNYSIVANVLGSANSQRIVILRDFAGRFEGGFNTLLKALVNGYTVKQEPITVTITPEQQEAVREYSCEINPYLIERVLDMLGITIEGVNDK